MIPALLTRILNLGMSYVLIDPVTKAKFLSQTELTNKMAAEERSKKEYLTFCQV